MSKQRLDLLLVERGLAESREQAQRLILAGKVLVDGRPSPKAGHSLDALVPIELKSAMPFVSRGGEKLEAAFATFNLAVTGLQCIDVGASTGGFTDCLLQHGAARVVAVDVGKAQLHWRIAGDLRVTVLDGYNARNLQSSDLPFSPRFATVDVSFISLEKILPALVRVMEPGSEMVTLIKPQFEAGREQVQKGGVVRDAGVRAEVVERIKVFGAASLRLSWLGACESPLKGPAGNTEFLAHWRCPAQP